MKQTLLLLLFYFLSFNSFAQDPLFSLSIMDSTNLEIDRIVREKMNTQKMQDSIIFLTKRGWPEQRAFDHIGKGLRDNIIAKEFPVVFRVACRKIFKNSMVTTNQVLTEAKANSERPDFSEFYIPLEVRKTWMAYTKTVYWEYQSDIQSQFSKRLWIDYSKACITHLKIHYQKNQDLKYYYPNFNDLSNRITGNY